MQQLTAQEIHTVSGGIVEDIASEISGRINEGGYDFTYMAKATFVGLGCGLGLGLVAGSKAAFSIAFAGGMIGGAYAGIMMLATSLDNYLRKDTDFLPPE